MNTTQHKQYPFFRYTDIICFSHLRWGFVFQRPQHLLTRFAKVTRVFYVEEPIFFDGETHMELTKHGDIDLFVLVPYLQHGTPQHEVDGILKGMVDNLIDNKNIDCYCAWYYTPMALSFTSHLRPTLVVFDCMDELSAFKFAPPELKERERQLLERADIAYTRQRRMPTMISTPSPAVLIKSILQKRGIYRMIHTTSKTYRIHVLVFLAWLMNGLILSLLKRLLWQNLIGIL
jgi:hypothetical protein